MKLTIVLLIISASIFSCTKQNEVEYMRCGTNFNQPGWAKNFLKDSLLNVSSFVFVNYHSQSPSYQNTDTTYNLSVPVRFFSNGSGILNNNTSFTYSIVLTENYPELHISGLSDVSSIFPFVNNFLGQSVLKIKVESFLKTAGQFSFTNGVQYPLTTQKYESCYLSFMRN